MVNVQPAGFLHPLVIITTRHIMQPLTAYDTNDQLETNTLKGYVEDTR